MAKNYKKIKYLKLILNERSNTNIFSNCFKNLQNTFEFKFVKLVWMEINVN